ncbi:MAG: hypothetical protein H6841_04595 [Planctomycetes bacterium]|nr:hypothetical protein [Planctomycetota bacterium]MCB9934670.1 hypothetical protein [Planctomycetota bacterium]
MKKLTGVLALVVLLAACQSSPTANNVEDDNPCSGAFGSDSGEDGGEPADEPQIVLERTDVQEFRGTEMVKLLKSMESLEPDDWRRVRRHVFPPPQSPYQTDNNGKVVGRNYEWPPEDMNKLSDKQKRWKSFLLWPEHIRELLIDKDWSSEESRKRLANYGAMYELLHEFQTRQPYSSPTRESEYWRQFAERLLAYGKDGEQLLVANMIVALSNPSEDVVYQAQEILVQVGDPAIEPLCAALWTSHRQLVAGWEEEIDPKTGQRIRTEVYRSVGNPNYNKYIADALYRMGPRVVPQAIFELENSLIVEGPDKGKFIGPGWRYRRWFVELLGRFGDARALRTLEAEIDRVVVQEYDENALAEGKQVIDRNATDDANFVWHEHLIQALGQLKTAEAIRPVIKLWKQDDFHEVAALTAISQLAKRRVRSMAEAREVAKSLKVDLKGE